MTRPASRKTSLRQSSRVLARALRRTFLRPQMVAFLPALLLGGYWFGGQGVLMIVALTFPLLLVLGGMFEREIPVSDRLTGALTKESLETAIDAALDAPTDEAETATLIALEIDKAEQLHDTLGPAAMDTILCRTAERLAGAARSTDSVARIGEHRFAVLLHPMRNAGMDLAVRTAERLQGAVGEPLSVDSGSVYASFSVGICLERRAPRRNGAAMIAAALAALQEARIVGDGAVRAYSTEMRARADQRQTLADDLVRALEEGEIVPWFQPQVAAATGAITGMEALARWQHPQSGVLAPAEFLPLAQATGQMERLGEAMLFHSLAALRKWDRLGLNVPQISVNFSSAELRNPKLTERVQWELDRFDLAPNRLVIEVLETVVTETGDDTIVSNLAKLARLGCAIDLDDFGTGAASISNIRRFGVSRIKIDRSFVTRVDADAAQQQMVAAILSMAEKLNVATLAEGVETVAEHRLLAEMGCGHIQGFTLARPMPLDEAESWLIAYAKRAPGFIAPRSAAG